MSFVLPLLENIALLAIPALIYLALPRIKDGWSEQMRSVLLGLALGGASATVMLVPIELEPGFIFDARGAPVLLSGIIGGPVAAILATIPPILMRISIGGAGMAPGVAALALFGLFSIAAWYGARRLGRQWRFLPLIGFSAVATLMSIPALFLLPSIDMALALIGSVVPILLVSNVAGTAIFAAVIEVEMRRQSMIEALQESEAAAKRALGVRTRFTSTMSHELRTPLNAVLGYAKLLDDNTLSATQSDRLKRLSSAADALLHLIDDILQFSSIQSGKLTTIPQPTDLAKTMSGAIDLVRRDADLKGLKVSCNTSQLAGIAVTIDGMRLQQVLANILSNAVKFTDQGSITITSVVRDDRLTISIQDTGQGIASDQTEKAFEPFERFQTMAAPGTGLGLTIVKSVVDAMGGDVTMHSEPDTGTTVWIDLPVVVETLEAGPEASDGQTVPIPTEANCDILVVDDIAINADIAKAMLEGAGCRVATVDDGDTAIAAVKERPFDAVIMDIEMPRMNGLEATRAMRAPEMPDHVRTVPVIALTAHATRNDLQTCLNAGMNGYLTKPVDRKALLEALVKAGVLGSANDDWRPVDPPAEPVFDDERFAQLSTMLPAETLSDVVQESRTQLEAFGVEITAPATDDTARRQALHKVISIAGNLGLIELSTLSRQQHDALRDGHTLSDADTHAYRASIDRALNNWTS